MFLLFGKISTAVSQAYDLHSPARLQLSLSILWGRYSSRSFSAIPWWTRAAPFSNYPAWGTCSKKLFRPSSQPNKDKFLNKYISNPPDVNYVILDVPVDLKHLNLNFQIIPKKKSIYKPLLLVLSLKVKWEIFAYFIQLAKFG